MKKVVLSIGTLLLIIGAISGQQQVNFTQYMFNGAVINPGYIGSHDALSISALSRWQWSGFDGAPRVQTLSVHTPIPGKNFALGMQFTHDEVAVTTNDYFMFGGSYKIPVGSGFLSMGLQGGFQIYSVDYRDAFVLDASQEDFSENFQSTIPNFGYGLFYYSPTFYAGISSPLVLTNTVSENGNNLFTQRQHYYTTAGMVFTLSENIKAKPNILLKMVEGAPVTADYNLNFLFSEIFWAGVSYRPPESINFLVEININQRFRFGYAYDYIIEETLSNVTSSSHEILLNYRVNLVKDKVENPRYF